MQKPIYDSVEEGKGRTIQLALERTGMMDCGGRFVLLDLVQFMEMKFSEYKDLIYRQ